MLDVFAFSTVKKREEEEEEGIKKKRKKKDLQQFASGALGAGARVIGEKGEIL